MRKNVTPPRLPTCFYFSFCASSLETSKLAREQWHSMEDIPLHHRAKAGRMSKGKRGGSFNPAVEGKEDWLVPVLPEDLLL